MAVISTRTITIIYSGDISGSEVIEAATNQASPGAIEVRTFTSGFNALSVPTGGSVPKAVTIVPPVENTVQLTLKGISGDTGLALHLTDPTTIAIAPSVTSIGLTAADNISGVRIYWS